MVNKKAELAKYRQKKPILLGFLQLIDIFSAWFSLMRSKFRSRKESICVITAKNISILKKIRVGANLILEL